VRRLKEEGESRLRVNHPCKHQRFLMTVDEEFKKLGEDAIEILDHTREPVIKNTW
jgi:hypothetical protein